MEHLFRVLNESLKAYVFLIPLIKKGHLFKQPLANKIVGIQLAVIKD
jgi:hypothetical protein